MAKWLGRLCVAVAVGFVGAIPFTTAAGIVDMRDREVGVPIAGVVIGLLTMTGLVFGERQLRNLIAVLATTKQRPHIALVIVLICAGLFCFLIAVVLQLVGGHNASISAPPGGMSFSVSSSVMIPVSTLALLLAGAVLIGIGVWGSIPLGVHESSSIPQAKDSS